MTKRAAIYARISQDRTGAGLGVERQREDCAALAERLPAEVVTTYSDNDLSAYSGKPRKGYLELLDAITAGQVDVVLAWHEDRLHRSPRELEDYIDACQPRGVATHFVQAGELDLATASGRMTARIRGAISRGESEHKAERIRRAHRQSAEAGRWRGGLLPFGWDVAPDGTATLNKAEARAVRKATEDILAGASLGSIVAEMNAEGIQTSTGRAWNYTSLRQVITRPRNAGLSTLNGEVVGRLTWPAIVTEDQWRGVCAVLNDKGRRRSTSNRVRHLLAGLAVCGKPGCGAPLKSASVTTRTKGVYRTVYRCSEPGKGHVARDAAALEDHVVRLLLGILAKPQTAPALADGSVPSSESLRLDAVALRAQMGEAADLFAESKITAAQLTKINARLQERLEVVEDDMARAARGSALAQFVGRDPAKVWKSLTMDRKRDVVRELMTITVLPTGRTGKVYNPDSVRIEPKESE